MASILRDGTLAVTGIQGIQGIQGESQSSGRPTVRFLAAQNRLRPHL